LRTDEHVALAIGALGGISFLGLTGMAVAPSFLKGRMEAAREERIKIRVPKETQSEPKDGRVSNVFSSGSLNTEDDRAVITVQSLLEEEGFPIEIDGRWGGKTEAALKRWQWENDFRADGQMSQEQWDLMHQQREQRRAVRSQAVPPDPRSTARDSGAR
jgi:hypothetical protein